MKEIDWNKPITVIGKDYIKRYDVRYIGNYDGQFIVGYKFDSYSDPVRRVITADRYGEVKNDPNMRVENAKVKKMVWINLYKRGPGKNYYETRSEAEEASVRQYCHSNGAYLGPRAIEIEVEA